MTWEEAEFLLPEKGWCPSAHGIFDDFRKTGLFTPEECLVVAKEEANAQARHILMRLRRKQEEFTKNGRT